MPRCVSTPCPDPSTTTKACGCRETMMPSTGDTASEGSRTGSIAVPGPTIAPEKTGSGTATSPMARPARGDVTVVMGSLPEVEIHEGPSLPVRDGALFEQGMSYEVPVLHERFRLTDVEP